MTVGGEGKKEQRRGKMETNIKWASVSEMVKGKSGKRETDRQTHTDREEERENERKDRAIG